MQLIAMLRLLDMRYSMHLENVFMKLDYCSLSFIPNLIDLTDESEDLSDLPASF